MKCRRCKTNFDYEKYYGICPKCAAYNRPDGRDELKEVMGEEAAAYEEEYRPPILSGGLEEASGFSEERETAKKDSNLKKSAEPFSERLKNPYLDGTDKKKKQKKVRQPKKKETTFQKLLSGIVVTVIVISVLFSVMDAAGGELLREVRQIAERIIYGEDLLGKDFGTAPGAYSEAFSVCGREISFGTPYAIRPEKQKGLSEEESLLIIAYQAAVTDEVLAEEYEMKCYLSCDGLYRYPVSPYLIGELYHEEENAGDLNDLYGNTEKSMVFAGDFTDLDEVELTLAFWPSGQVKGLPAARYRISMSFDGNIGTLAEWRKEEIGAFTFADGFGDPVIKKLDTYQGSEGKDSAFYEISQEFENNGEYDMSGTEMELFVSGDYEQFEALDSEPLGTGEPMDVYKRKILPPGERGVKKSVFEIPDEVNEIRATLYYQEGSREWRASL